VQFLYESGLIAGGRRVLVLRGADLRDAYLRKANLIGANLREAYLSGAELYGTNLSRAILGEAKGITNEKLEQQTNFLKGAIETSFLEGATMPNGQKYEDWLKDKEKRQQDE